MRLLLAELWRNVVLIELFEVHRRQDERGKSAANREIGYELAYVRKQNTRAVAPQGWTQLIRCKSGDAENTGDRDFGEKCRLPPRR